MRLTESFSFSAKELDNVAIGFQFIIDDFRLNGEGYGVRQGVNIPALEVLGRKFIEKARLRCSLDRMSFRSASDEDFDPVSILTIS